MKLLKTIIAGLTTAAALATPLSAQAADTQIAIGGCPANQVCLYYYPGFQYMRIQTAQYGRCWYLGDYDVNGHVWSYVNNLRREVTLHGGSEHEIGSVVWRIRSTGSSSDSHTVSGSEQWMCTKSL